jgi:hypothetical protein
MNGMRGCVRGVRGGESRSRTVVNPSMGTAGETSLFRTLRERLSPPRTPRGDAAAFMNVTPPREGWASHGNEPFINSRG